MISQLIVEYRKTNSQLQSAIESDSHKDLEALDAQITEIWNRIVDFEPRDRDEVNAKADFLINQLLENLPASENMERVANKLRELISMGVHY